MVFVVKYRKDLITPKIFELIKRICEGIEKRDFLKFDAVGYGEDHLHILMRSAPRYSPSRIMQKHFSNTDIQKFSGDKRRIMGRGILE